ncbi:histidinol-phosphate transaminase [Thermotalea metallivorans]|uniref:Histidinol-phosphate aminotransferase n=1 Tax=Thermotalea metallivorans TaxID=520762 RepID=A0A140L9I6_9FIRM|nr:histidinol-phosphate transaminase [Thermotalea metallivorans]KXG77211.1 Histidinol-phosphate aminotransferase 2 [Thermotalea metallivorans]
MNNLIKDAVRSLRPYKTGQKVLNVKLDANESPYAIFHEIKDDFLEMIGKAVFHRYPDSDSVQLRKALANYTNVKKENIICGNGSDEIIQMIVHSFIDKDDCIVIHKPTFSMYQIFTQMVGGKTIEVPCLEGFGIDIGGIIEGANKNKAKVIFLCNPNNPTGATLSRDAIMEILMNTKALVVVDEAYYEFFGETVVPLVREWKRLVVLRTLSKAFGLAGLRIGYGIAHEETMEILYRVKPPYNLNILSQAAGEFIMKEINRIQPYIQRIKLERDYLAEELSKVENIKVFPSAANFLWIQVKGAREVAKAMEEKGIGIKIFSNGPELENFIRITVGSRYENDQLLEMLRGVVKNT